MEILNGSDIVLEIDTTTATTGNRGTEANFKLVVCAVSNGMDGQTESQSTTNKCSGKWAQSIPGTKSWTMNLELQTTKLTVGEASTMYNHKVLKELWATGEEFFARITDATNSLDLYEEGKVYVSSYSDGAGTNEPGTVTVTLTGTGELYLAPVA